jgi:peptidyl-prolyl cis-trans isomerase SurA
LIVLRSFATPSRFWSWLWLQPWLQSWVAFITLAAVTGLGSTASAERKVEGIAAQVGNEIVLISEVMELAGPVEERMRQAGASQTEIALVRKDALERLIETRLLSSVVERLELGADREEVDAAVAAIAEDNELTIEQLLSSIASHGLSVDEYRSKIRGEIERSKVVNAMVRSRVQITEEEVRALYDEQFGKQRSGGEEIYLRHILVMTEGRQASSNQSACQIVRDARARIESGELEFTEIAQRVSDMNPERGGDLGWMHRDDLAGWMSDTIRDLEPGELSSVIEMPFGCNLLQLVDRREFRRVEYEQAKTQLQSIVFQRKTEVEYGKWLEVLRSQTYIERKAGFGG